MFRPVYKDYLWGNTRLPALLGREAAEGIYAESWEVSTHPDGESIVANGELAERTFSEIIKIAGTDILGTSVAGEDFPLLIKLIDAAQPLSVQVHPNDKNAQSAQGEPKTEMWYFLSDEPAQVYCGLKPGTTREEFLAANEREALETVLRRVPAEKGGAVFVPGGRVHAIDAWCLILEVQQNSNTTYRVYDWGRVDANGNPRETHLEKALQVIDFDDPADPLCSPVEVAQGRRNICTSPYFVLDEVTLDGPLSQQAAGDRFRVLFSADAAFEIQYNEDAIERIPRATSVLVPANLGAYTIRTDVPIKLLEISVPAQAILDS